MEHAPDVNDTFATRFLGIVLGVGLMISFVLLANSMGWHQAVGGILTGLSGAILGALGTSVHGRNTAAILGWAGGVNFILGILMFFGLGKAFPLI
jgi:hypothetical protein